MQDEVVKFRIEQGEGTFRKNWEAGERVSRKTRWTKAGGKPRGIIWLFYTLITVVETQFIWPAQYDLFIQINQISNFGYKSYKNSLQNRYCYSVSSNEQK